MIANYVYVISFYSRNIHCKSPAIFTKSNYYEIIIKNTNPLYSFNKIKVEFGNVEDI